MADQIQTQDAPAQSRLESLPEPRAERFKAEMPQIPGVIAGGPSGKRRSINPAIPLGIGIAAVLFVALLGTRLLSHPKAADPIVAAPVPQIEVPAPAVDPNSLLPHATEAEPQIATVAEMSKLWTSKNFF